MSKISLVIVTEKEKEGWSNKTIFRNIISSQSEQPLKELRNVEDLCVICC
jgi:hypothetical protein